METTGDFNGTEINYSKEYCEARKFMGQKTTDMDRLHETVTHLYLQCPEDMQHAFLALLEEIGQRQMMTDFPQLFNATGLGALD